MKADELDQMLYDMGKVPVEVPEELNTETYALLESARERKETMKHGVLLAIALFTTGLFTLISLGVICISILQGNYALLAIAGVYLIIECGVVALTLLIKENLLVGLREFKSL